MDEDSFQSVEEWEEAQRGTLRPPPPVTVGPEDPIRPSDVRAGLAEMGALIPGFYTVSDLYAWYAFAARQAGVEPVSSNAYGRYLTRHKFKVVSRRVGGKVARCRHLTRRILHEDPSDPSSPIGTEQIEIRTYRLEEFDDENYD